MISKIATAAIYGIDGIRIDVEVDISMGLPSFNIVGLPEASVKESKERVRAAIRNAGFEFPNDRITINLAPADVRKEGSSFDLPIAVGILASAGVIKQDAVKTCLIAGELSLDGRIKGVRGILPTTILARNEGILEVIVPLENGKEASIIQGVKVYGAQHLLEIVHFLKGDGSLTEFGGEGERDDNPGKNAGLDFSDVKGQAQTKRALEIAASGSHNVLMIGSPGSGKTMLARRIPSVMPRLSYDEAIETTKIHSIAGLLDAGRFLVVDRPFRAPHHTISDAGLIGGGHVPKPGEVSLAHNGVLFLDEFPEFKRNVLEALRQPLEDGNVTVSRVNHAITFPARFMLVAAMNPCPCGYWGDSRRSCSCSGTQIHRYRSRISGPLIDRIDIHVEVPPITIKELSMDTDEEEPSEKIRTRVLMARRVQQERFQGKNIYANGQMTTRMIKKYCVVNDSGKGLLEKAVEKFGLSPRAYHRILRVARTIADLEGEKHISEPHVAEAIQYRVLDKRPTL
ncbi:YifB family Mg chelatase-like AAA ATPase [Syntrophorhabdus aromaticivorans]|uniref:YifB family Mg chelatase-like AAA ATPase n=1 Tax=Syntrophorhabdus aromaticivorans TaxID=328301 RepID=A0A351U594_9BACT|nr:YifB family Mg chelatase-like AAA ATPase [Syntrophorhabdus aromaticivorans]NLW35324.1 YifB family Mg chelatase-like AAA ATPase [Syntrophorhabdus aromaticivorans]HBA55125.1 ATP-binding protein [Syntrophorhabdus aromaticivorans]